MAIYDKYYADLTNSNFQPIYGEVCVCACVRACVRACEGVFDSQNACGISADNFNKRGLFFFFLPEVI